MFNLSLMGAVSAQQRFAPCELLKVLAAQTSRGEIFAQGKEISCWNYGGALVEFFRLCHLETLSGI